jgi:hypothetical protein
MLLYPLLQEGWFVTTDWFRSYLRRSRGGYWCGKRGTGNDHVHEPVRWFDYRKNNVVA